MCSDLCENNHHVYCDGEGCSCPCHELENEVELPEIVDSVSNEYPIQY